MFFIKFEFKNRKVEITARTRTELYIKILDWLWNNGYKFEGNLHNAFIKKLLNKEEVDKSSYTLNRFHKLPNGLYFYLYRNKDVQNFWIQMLEKFGIDKNSIEIKNDSSYEIKNFHEFDDGLQEEPVEKIKVYKQNPFKQAICVLGESGSGKSVTIETILEKEKHEFEFIIPTAATTGLLAQFSPSKSTYVASRLGRMLVQSSNNPQTLYTAVFDEMHKSNVIEMINDELLQAISTRRNNGVRFISLDDDTAEIYEDSSLETKRGNLLIPDNFGFIFISSKPKVITSNADFFNRVDMVLLKSYEEELIKTSEQLLSKVLDKEEKSKLEYKRGED